MLLTLQHADDYFFFQYAKFVDIHPEFIHNHDHPARFQGRRRKSLDSQFGRYEDGSDTHIPLGDRKKQNANDTTSEDSSGL
jgi:hypothetical protein